MSDQEMNTLADRFTRQSSLQDDGDTDFDEEMSTARPGLCQWTPDYDALSFCKSKMDPRSRSGYCTYHKQRYEYTVRRARSTLSKYDKRRLSDYPSGLQRNIDRGRNASKNILDRLKKNLATVKAAEVKKATFESLGDPKIFVDEIFASLLP